MREIFLLVLTSVLVIKILRKPIFGLYCAVFFLPFGKWALINIGNSGFLYIYFIVAVTFFSELIKKITYNEKIPNMFIYVSYLLILIFFLYMVFSIVLSYKMPYASYRGELPFTRSIKQIVLFSFAMLFYFQIIYYVNNSEVLNKIFKFYTASLIFLTFICFIEFLDFYFTNPVTTFIFNFWHNSKSGSGIFDLFAPAGLQRGVFPRLRGLESEPSILGMYLVLSFYFILLIKQTYGEKYLRKLKYLPYALVIALMFTFSRSAQMIFAFGILILFALRHRKLKIKMVRLIMFCFLVILVIPFLISPLRQSIFEITKLKGTDESKMTRYINLMTSVNVFKNNWLFGVGIGNFGFYYSDNLYRETDTLPHEVSSMLSPDSTGWPVTNNMITRILVELGVVGFLLFMFFQFYIWTVALRILRNKQWKTFGVYYLVIFLLILAFYFTNESFQFFVYWFFPGIIVATYNVLKHERLKNTV